MHIMKSQTEYFDFSINVRTKYLRLIYYYYKFNQVRDVNKI